MVANTAMLITSPTPAIVPSSHSFRANDQSSNQPNLFALMT